MSIFGSKGDDPHAGAKVSHAGAPLDQAKAVVILLHGRGGTAQDILSLGRAFGRDDLALIAPQAKGHTWYPQSFLADFDHNEPYLSSAHNLVETILTDLQSRGFSSDRCGMVGFSQGACLTLDHAQRFPRRYGFLAAYTGGFIGPPGTRFAVGEGLSGTPAFLGANDPDPHVPWERVEESATLLENAGATVELMRYPGEPHSVNADEIERTKPLIEAMLGSGAS